MNIRALKNKLNSASPVAKASIAYIMVNIFIKGISFLASPIYTRLLSTDEYGQVMVWLSWTSMIGCIAMFCLSSGVFNNGLMDYKTDRERYSFSILILSNIITAVTSVVFFLLKHIFPNLIEMDNTLAILMFVVFFTQPAYSFWVTRQRYEYKYKSVSIVSLCSVLVSVICAIICILVFKENKVYSRLFGAEIPLILLYIFFFALLSYKAKFRVNTHYWKEAFLFNLPLIPHYFSGYILNHSDRLMIAALLDDTNAAFYSLAYSVSALISTIWLAINGALIPYTYEKCEKKDYKSLSHTTSLILLLFAVPCLVIVLAAPEIISLLAPSAYKESIYVIPPIIGGVYVSSLYYIFANVIYYYKKPKFVMFASVVSAVANIVLNYFFIPVFGYAAAGYTTLFCYLLQAILDYAAMRSVVKEKVYKYSIIVVITATVVVFSLVSALLYDYVVLRYGIVLLFFTACFVFRKRIVSVFSSIKKK